MRIVYYDQDDILFVEISNDPIVRDESLSWNLHIGYTADGIGEITILDAQKSGIYQPKAADLDDSQSTKRATLSKAVARCAERLGISQPLLAQILGVSPATVTRLYTGDYHLEPRGKEWECARLFVRLFLSLASIVGDEDTARQWLCSENRALNARPIDLIGHAEGLERVVCYLEDSRGLV